MFNTYLHILYQDLLRKNYCNSEYNWTPIIPSSSPKIRHKMFVYIYIYTYVYINIAYMLYYLYVIYIYTHISMYIFLCIYIYMLNNIVCIINPCEIGQTKQQLGSRTGARIFARRQRGDYVSSHTYVLFMAYPRMFIANKR